MTSTSTLATVIVLTGPSGSGKTRLADRLSREHHWPVVRLDDFYKDEGDPTLPGSSLGIPDWDDVRSWHLDTAVGALDQLCRTGQAVVPVYDISLSRQVGTRSIELHGADRVLAEGIFAADVIAALSERGLLAHAICVRQPPTLTFGRRLVRDLAERRKPPVTLLRRGLRLMRAEPAIVAAHAARGAVPMTPKEAERAVLDRVGDQR